MALMADGCSNRGNGLFGCAPPTWVHAAPLTLAMTAAAQPLAMPSFWQISLLPFSPQQAARF
jgi:hypothetical protein